MEFDDSDAMRRICAERLGETAGRQFAAMARRGFGLTAATDAVQPTGRCRVGGPALLEPDAAWPEFGGYPLSLHAVLDTDALAPWLGDQLPCRPGLLNFFYLDPDAPYEEHRHLDAFDPAACRVIPADPARAVDRIAPKGAMSYPLTPIHATGVTMLPDCWDVEDDDIAYDTDRHWGAPSVLLDAMDGIDGNSAGGHRAFGWPDTSYAAQVTYRDAGGPAVHLLQLAEDAALHWGWGDAGTLYFLIPAKAYEAGDFSQAEVQLRCC